MLEVEIKARIKNRTEILQKLDKLGCTIKRGKEQEDRVFIKKEIQNFENPLGENIIRLRREESKNILTLKKKMQENKACLELESLIEDYESVSRMLEEMGYKQVAIIKKKRMRYALDKMSICIDSVEDLGDFIEVEIMTEENNESQEKAILEIENFFKKLDIDKEDYEEKRYDTLMYELNKK